MTIQNFKKFIKYNNLFVIISGLCLMIVLPLKIDIPWVSAAVRTGLGRAIVLIVPEDMSVEEFLAGLGLSKSGSFSKPKISSKILSPEQRNTTPENIVLWLKDKDGNGILDTQDFSRYIQEIKENKNGELLEITNNAMLFPTSYIGIEIWLRGVPSGVLLKAGESYQIEKQGSSLYFKLNNENAGSLTVPSDAKAHQVILSFDGISVHLGLDGKEKQQFTPFFATLSPSAENLLVNPHLESLRIFSQPMDENRFWESYNELAFNFGRESLKKEEEVVCSPNWVCGEWTPDPSSVMTGQQFTQTRTCTDQNNCGTDEGKPLEEQIAVGIYQPPTEEDTDTSGDNGSGGGSASPEVILTASTSTAATGTEILFTATAKNFATNSLAFVWNFGDGASTTSETNSISHSYNATGTYGVSVIVTSGNQQVSTSTTIEITSAENLTEQAETSCDNQHLDLCDTEADCISASGFWYQESCHSEPEQSEGEESPTCTSSAYYLDSDNDTYGNPNNTTTTCDTVPPAGYVTNNTDCNDSDPNINPSAAEICDGIDNNCSGQVDENCDCGTTSCDPDGTLHLTGEPCQNPCLGADGCGSCRPTCACADGWLDCNGDGSGVDTDGCEFQKETPTSTCPTP